MSFFESQIDQTEFGIVADYLLSPRSPICFILHVKHEALLPKLAQELDLLLQSRPIPADCVPALIAHHLRDGSVKISSRHNIAVPVPRSTINAANVPRRAPCKVIYLSPFYIVHTPGLFDGTPVSDQEPSL